MKLRRIVYLSFVALAIAGIAGCGKVGGKKEFTVLIRMMPAQERYFKEQVIPAFEQANNCKINVATFTDEYEIERILKLDAANKNPTISLVKTPFEMTRDLASKGYLKCLYDIEDSSQINADLAEYHPLASGLGFYDGKPYYIPRKLETRIMFYSKSKVADAVSKFEKHRKRINDELKKENGYGLPAGYTLESDPAQWDFYDLYVVGSIWANESYNGVKMPRIAHRGARYFGTALDLVDKSIQLGANKEDILRLTSDKTVEAYVWERVFVRDSIYNPGMWQDPWKGANLYNGIKDGKIFLTNIQQIDAFLIHGWKDDAAMPSYLADESDMGLTTMPKAVSFELDNSGKPQFEGTKSVSTGGWWWGISKSAPNAKLAYDFARFITNRENQAKECSRFGMVPVRKDILSKIPEVFDQGWVGDIFKTSVDQITFNELSTVPVVKSYSDLSQNLIDAWYGLCVEYKEPQGEQMNFSTMKMRLASDYLEKQKKILGSDFPE